MQFLERGNEVLLLTDENNLLSLEKAVSLKAMSLAEDCICYNQGIENSNGKEISEDDLLLSAEILNALSGALAATKSRT